MYLQIPIMPLVVCFIASILIFLIFRLIYKRYRKALHFTDTNWIYFYAATIQNRQIDDNTRAIIRQIYYDTKPSIQKLMLIGGPYSRDAWFNPIHNRLFFDVDKKWIQDWSKN